jgi:hypothetical protein
MTLLLLLKPAYQQHQLIAASKITFQKGDSPISFCLLFLTQKVPGTT